VREVGHDESLIAVWALAQGISQLGPSVGATMRTGSPGSILPAVKNRGQNVLNAAQLQRAMFDDYLGGRPARRFAVTLLRLLVRGFLVLAA
jgi:hypothetical protein